MNYAIAIDIGGTNTRVALVDQNNQIVDRKQFTTNPMHPDITIEEIVKIIASYDYSIKGIGMSCPGPLDLIGGKVLTPPNLRGGWHNYPVVKELHNKTGLPTFLNNDANLAALGEATIGEGRNYNVVQFLTISTGIGAGLVIDKNIFIGTHGYAMEVANCIMMEGGPSQGTIKPGGIEAISSGTAITTRAKAAGLNVKHAGEVNELALKGKKEAVTIMNDAKLYLANFIATLYAAVDPGIVILGGSVALKVDGFVEEVEKLVKDRVFDIMRPNVRIVKTALGEDSGLIGAAALAFSSTKEV
ncbi:MAG: ROK family protein [Lachnospiraceae bacterium]|nr:ROK family protein [Lachnospiraceae bacterium]